MEEVSEKQRDLLSFNLTYGEDMLSMMIILFLGACEEEVSLQYYSSCGDPACEGYNGPIEGLSACGEVLEGDSCSEEGAECDLENVCNQKLICAAEDPAQECPVSKAKYKHEIEYLSRSKARDIAGELKNMKIAEWKYKTDSNDRKARLGFLIDDNMNSPAVHANGERVDLYGYISMAVVTIQQQQAQIDALEKRVIELESLLEPR